MAFVNKNPETLFIVIVEYGSELEAQLSLYNSMWVPVTYLKRTNTLILNDLNQTVDEKFIKIIFQLEILT